MYLRLLIILQKMPTLLIEGKCVISNSKKNYKTKERDDTMAANAGTIVSQSVFDSFLKSNMEKINAIVPKNPTISENDEWRSPEYDVYEEVSSKG